MVKLKDFRIVALLSLRRDIVFLDYDQIATEYSHEVIFEV